MATKTQIFAAVDDCIRNHALSRASADNQVERVIEWYVRMDGDGPFRLYDVLKENEPETYPSWLPEVLTMVRVGDTVVTGGGAAAETEWKRVRPPR